MMKDVNSIPVKPMYIWTLYSFLIVIIAYIAIKACSLVIPYYGVILERCPNPSELSINVADDEGKRLLDEFLSLRAALALSPACDDAFIEGIKPPPPIRQSNEVVFVIDASPSMDERSGIGDLKKRDVAKDLLKELMIEPYSKPNSSLWRYGETCSHNTAQLIKPDSLASESDIDQAFGLSTYSSLAKAILDIPRMVEAGSGLKEDNPANVVLVVDGDDNCGNHPAYSDERRNLVAQELKNRPDIDIDDPVSRVCGAAKRVYNLLPHLAIHVVSLFPSGSEAEEKFSDEMECITGNNKGWYINSPDASKIKQALKVITGGS